MDVNGINLDSFRVGGKAPMFAALTMSEEEQIQHDAEVVELLKLEDEEHAMHNFMICGAERNYLKKVDFRNYIIINGNFKQTMLKNMAHGEVDAIRSGKCQNMVILGDSGIGKTFTSLCILKEVCRTKYVETREETSRIMKDKYPTYTIDRWYTGIYTTSDDLNWRLKEAESYNAKVSRKKIVEGYTTCKLLIIDEIGRTESKKEKDNLFSVVDKRIQNGLSTIFISNLNRDDFAKVLGPALYDRINSSSITWTSDNTCPHMRTEIKNYRM